MPKFETDAECDDCGGTGLYVGFAEHDGSAVVCKGCKGTGRMKISVTYKEFTERKNRKGIKRVYQTNPGIGIGKGDGKYKLEDFGGMKYQDWLNGKKFVRGTEMRKYTCPAWWYQSADYSKKPEWENCNRGLVGSNPFSMCKFFGNKNKCWDRFDREQQGTKG